MEKPTFYLTTAIVYTTKTPHIGNVYEAILSDSIVRYKKDRGYDTYFLTGTDEHGEKIADIARENGRTPQQHVDIISEEIKRIWKLVDVDYDQFIRTTDKKHKKVVQHIFKKLYDQGDIYKGKYEGWYCVPDESFWTENQLNDDKRCPECKREVVWKSEEAYFFKLSKYVDRLLEHYEKHPEFIIPAARKNEMINTFIKPGLQDLCVSRTSFDHGVAVDFDPGHVVYVWIDALSNYITAMGYDVDEESDLFKKFWPADLHVVGKDIMRFHVIYWPIILMALGVELPKQVLGHGWLLSGSGKMSKSLGNVLYTDDLVGKYGVDTIRHYILREMDIQNDGHIDDDLIVSRYNSDLANTLGNLVHRTITMACKYFNGNLYGEKRGDDIEFEIQLKIKDTVNLYKKYMDDYEISKSVELVFDLFRRLNKYIDETSPWILAKDKNNEPKLRAVIYHLLEGIRIGALLLRPFMPTTSKKILSELKFDLWENFDYDLVLKFGTYNYPMSLKQGEVLFERISV